MLEKLKEVFESFAEKEGFLEKKEIAKVEGDLLAAHKAHVELVRSQREEMDAFIKQKNQEIKDKADALQLIDKINHDKVWGQTYEKFGIDADEHYEIDIETGVLTQVIFKGGEEEK